MGLGQGQGEYRRFESQVDGVVSHQVAPGYLWEASGGGIKLGLLRGNSSENDQALMRVLVRALSLIESKEGVAISIDGKITKLSSPSKSTEGVMDLGYAFAEKTFPIKKELIAAMVNGKKVFVKVVTNGGYVEGEFSSDSITTPRGGFKEFLEKAF